MLGHVPLMFMNILATRFVPVDKIVPDEKLNRARAKAGKPLLTSYYKVNTTEYVTALKAGSKQKTAILGHHASPIPHLRRAHQRHLGEDKVIWVRDAIVNSRHPEEFVGFRQHYRVP